MPNEPVIHLNLTALEQEIKHVERFRRVSVLMVDYAMPTLNGLEFCEGVKNKDIKKALLTGVADEKTAVAAFNRGIIDRYIPKGSLRSVRDMIPHVEALKRAYFDQYSARLNENLALNPPAFMLEPNIAKAFDEVVTKHSIVEYYLVTEPNGYMMLRADGSMIRLVVLSQTELQAQLELARSYGAPQQLLSQIQAGKLIGYLFEHPRDYLGHEDYPWAEMLIPALRIDGDEPWFIGVADNPPADIDFDPAQSSFDAFLGLKRPIV